MGIDWVDANPNAEREEYEAKKKEIEDIWRPIISAAYGGAQGGGGMPGMGGMLEWEECPTWETLEEHHHQTAETLRDQRSMKWTKRVNEWNIVFCKDMRLCCAHF